MRAFDEPQHNAWQDLADYRWGAGRFSDPDDERPLGALAESAHLLSSSGSVRGRGDDRLGDPLLAQSFWSKVSVDSSGCWRWTGHVNFDGYAHYSEPKVRRVWLAHRYAYTQLVGPIPAGQQVDHLCSVRSCVNPAHLEAVSPRENTMRSNAVTARNARKTECTNGHPFTEGNTYVRPSTGHRGCRICIRERGRARRRTLEETQGQGLSTGEAAADGPAPVSLRASSPDAPGTDRLSSPRMAPVEVDEASTGPNLGDAA